MMRPLALDYVATRASGYRAGLAVLAAAVAVAAVTASLYADHAEDKAANQLRRSQLERLHKRQAGNNALSGVSAQALQAEIRQANEVTAQLDLPWGPLFNAVEAASHDTVALLGIQPDAQKRMVLIAAEAKDMVSAVDYVNRLAQAPILSDVHLVNHQVLEQEPGRPLRFAVQAVWREKGREK